MSTVITKKRTREKAPDYRHLGCPLTKSHTLWCFHLCTPVQGKGDCGRLAPHGILGKTREAILRHRQEQLRAEAQQADSV